MTTYIPRSREQELITQLQLDTAQLDRAVSIIRCLQDLSKLSSHIKYLGQSRPFFVDINGADENVTYNFWQQLALDFPVLVPLVDVINEFHPDFDVIFGLVSKASNWHETIVATVDVMKRENIVSWKVLTAYGEKVLFDTILGRTISRYQSRVQKTLGQIKLSDGDDLVASHVIDADSILEEFYKPLLKESTCSDCQSSGRTNKSNLYHKLPQGQTIRLFVLQPGAIQDPLVGHLQCYNIDHVKQSYEALSYSWVVMRNFNLSAQKISCNDVDVEVGANLWLAMRRLRLSDRPRILWIDGLWEVDKQYPINQLDKEEKGQQVALMSVIYRQASQTIIWLGDYAMENELYRLSKPASYYHLSLEDHSFEPEKCLDVICKLVNGWHSSALAKYTIRGQLVRGGPESKLPTLNEQEWESFDRFFRTRWFFRRWVIQEVVLSTKSSVLCGECVISWWIIGLASSILRTHYYGCPEYISMKGAHNAYLIFRLGRHGFLKPIELKFLQLFRLAAGFEATVYADKIYALLGIRTLDHDASDRPLLQPNYTLGVEEHGLLFVEALLQTDTPLSFLCGLRSSRFTDSTPSWVPAWLSSLGAEILAPWSIDEQYNTSRGLEFSGKLDESRKQLLVSGIHVSTVLCCGRVNHINSQGFIGDVDEFADLGFFKPTEQILALLARTLTAGRTQYGGREANPNALLKHFSALYASEEIRNKLKLSSTTKCFISSAGQALISKAKEVQDDGQSQIFSNIADHIATDRVLFITTSGHIGLGPMAMKPGCQLCVLAGCPMPVVLNSYGDHYSFVGECYVDGIMEGEAVEAMKSGVAFEGSLGRINSIPALDEHVKTHSAAKDFVEKLQGETLAALHAQTAVLKEVDFNIR